MEGKIEAAEARVASLSALLEDPKMYAERASEVPRIVADLEAGKREVEAAYRRWEELEAIVKAQ